MEEHELEGSTSKVSEEKNGTSHECSEMADGQVFLDMVFLS